MRRDNERDEHNCPFCGEGWPEKKVAAWRAYDLLHDIAETDGGTLGLAALDALREVEAHRD
jgi:hypothetical protein